MLAGVWLKDTIRTRGLVFLLAVTAYPGALAANPLELIGEFGLDARSFLLVGIFAGSMVFAVFAGGLFLRAAVHARKAAKRARESAEQLDADRASIRSLIAAEPQVLVRWELGGSPELAAATLDVELGVPGKAGEVVRYAAWLERNSAAELEERVACLLEAGEGFTHLIETASGAQLEAIGRASASGAILKIRDITGDRKEMAALGTKRMQLSRDVDVTRLLYDAIPMPVWFRDAQGRLDWVNQAYARAVDASGSDEVREQQIEFLNTRQRSAADQKLGQGESHTKRIHAVVSGERKAFDIIALPVGPASAGIAIDVAALEVAESALSRNIEENTRTLDRIATAVAIFSPDQRLQYYNQAYSDLWALEEAWLAAGPSDGEIMDTLRQRRCLPEQADYRSWKSKQLGRYETTSSHEDRWHLPDGRTVHVVANHGSDGSATYLYENITEELAMKSRYNALIHVQKETLDHLREGVAVFATDGRLKLFNPSFASIWKLNVEALDNEPHIDEVIGWCRVLLDDDAAWDEVKRAITSIDDEREPLEGHLSRPDGSMLAFAGLPLPDGATLLTYVDITDSKRVENALIERNEALVAGDKLKTAFISHVSYELRTPLTNIIGFAELLTSPATGPLNERQRDYLGDIQTSSDSLLIIINDILDLATIDAGALDLSIAPVKAKEVIEAAVVGVRERIKHGGLELQVRVSEDAQDFVADGKRVTQVLFNLLSNAIGFSEYGGTITIDCRREDDMIAIAVEDKGRGIPEDYQENAFDRFETRPQGSRHRGAGLGLTIVKNLVELHGGTVSLDSAPGVGTTVTVRLPVKPARSAEGPTLDVAQNAVAEQDAPPTPPAAATG
jgi:signal transduction histidine kinase